MTASSCSSATASFLSVTTLVTSLGKVREDEDPEHQALRLQQGEQAAYEVL
nr:putative integron gene cassette protein [uncultured bacterium]